MQPEEYAAIMRAARASAGLVRPPSHRSRGRPRLIAGDDARHGRPGRTAFRVALYFLWNSGARTVEMREARWEQLDWREGILRLPRHKTVAKVGKPRLVPLRAPVLRLLGWIWRKRGYPKTGHVFLNSRGAPWVKDQFAKRFREYARLAGVRDEVTAYATRHGFTCQALRNGVGERQVADALGHVSTRYVEWYGRSMRQDGAYLRAIADQAFGETSRPVQAPAPAPAGDQGGPAVGLPAGSCPAAIVAFLGTCRERQDLEAVHRGVQRAGAWALGTVRAHLGRLVRAGHVHAEGWPRRYRLPGKAR